MGEQVSGGQMFSGRLAGACSDGRQTGWHRGICVWRHHAIHTHTHTSHFDLEPCLMILLIIHSCLVCLPAARPGVLLPANFD